MSGAAGKSTLAGRWQHEAEINRSRFRAVAEPLTDAAQWEARLAALTDPAASHCCWAWRFGQAYRSADAGEPAGTAGRPILAAIEGQGIDRVLVIVLRWFGGTKLGVGGLVRAYGGTAAECLRRAPRLALIDRISCEMRCDFEHADAVYRMLTAHRASITHTHFASDGLHLQIDLPQAALDHLQTELGNVTRGRSQLAVQSR